jgi:hypothetical protein
MKQGHLSQYFIGSACKRLSAVEAGRDRSNQHEFDGVNDLRTVLGSKRTRFTARFLYLNDEDAEPLSEAGFLTWYDARENHPTRSEWRLYFPDTAVSERASENDLLVIARRPDNSIMVIVAAAGSTIENQILWLFGLADPKGRDFSTQDEADADGIRLAFAAKLLLEQIGIEIEESDDAVLEDLLNKFGGTFPSTAEFSAFARGSSIDANPKDDPDGAILVWLEKEEGLFRTLERHLIRERLKTGFSDDIDEFIQYSLSVQNRRKARAGAALESHVAHAFTELGLRYERTVRTEGKSKPDFLFPGAKEYRDASFPVSLLTMLGVKSTCKDRWRQVLAEADRIDSKHLLTLEPGISKAQTDEMKMRNVQLILPKEIHSSYSPAQQLWLMSVGDFVGLVRDRQLQTKRSFVPG